MPDTRQSGTPEIACRQRKLTLRGRTDFKRLANAGLSHAASAIHTALGITLTPTT